MTDSEQQESRPSDMVGIDDDDNDTTDLRSLLEKERRKTAELEFELERLLDDCDTFQEKLDAADEEIDDLLHEQRKLRVRLEHAEMDKRDYYSMKEEMEETRYKITEQQTRLDEQEQQLEEQHFLIQSLELEVDTKVDTAEERKKHIQKGRESYHLSKLAEKDKAIASLSIQLQSFQKNSGSVAKSNEQQRTAEKVQRLEEEKKELMMEVSVLKESLKDLQEKAKKAHENESKLTAMAKHSSDRTYEWKLRAEDMEEKLKACRLGRESRVSEQRSKQTKEETTPPPTTTTTTTNNEGGVQALLLQRAISNSAQKKKTGWGFGEVFDSATGDFSAMFSVGKSIGKDESPSTNNNTKDSSTTTNSKNDTQNNNNNNSNNTTIPTSNPNNDMSEMKEMNKTLKGMNVKLQKDIEKLERNHRKELTFNQKLVVKLQQENEKLQKKLEQGKKK